MRTFFLPVLLSILLSLSILAGSSARAETAFSIFDPGHRFQCSAIQEIGCSGLLPPRPAHSGEVALLLDEATGQTGELSLAARMQSLLDADYSIRVQALIFTGDESGLRIAELLKWKKRENPSIDIRVIVDAMSNPGWQSQWMYFDLKRHGIEVEGYEAGYLQWVNEASVHDLTRVNKRFHDKMWVVDAGHPKAVAVVGGLNIANEYFRVDTAAKNRWRDQDVIVRGKIVDDVAAVFDRNYDYFKDIKASRPDVFNTDKAWDFWRKRIEKRGMAKLHFRRDARIAARVEAARDQRLGLRWEHAPMRFFQSRPRFEELTILQAYVSMIRDASHPGGEVLVANAYFIPEPAVREALMAAARAGAQVRILTNSLEINDLPQLAVASRYYFKPLMEGGGPNLEIYEYHAERFGEGTLHAKFAVFDRQASIVGSYNLDARSQNLNSETALAFDNEVQSGRLAARFLERDLAMSQKVTPAQAAAWHEKKPKVRFSLGIAPML